MKYPQDKILGPWQDSTRPTKPTMAQDSQNLAYFQYYR